ncbi:ribokinase [Halovulum dunhuangense]|uniref:Ribokinase n=1 Tax=Halovulum dunhuangense TaxID=1505036 RepID=A0A849L0S7_9RHOB|nr:ribokinase [Halovulum dunhuangense]NNU79863.1 ribokinase [Halovulum dunhuangense]
MQDRARTGSIVILGIFVADTAFRAARQPRMGETILGSGFALGPGGKGSNQAVAAARAGGEVHFITRIGPDAFGDMALRTWEDAGVTAHAIRAPRSTTGAACIFLDEKTGDNAIIVYPGAAGQIVPADLDAQATLIGGAAVFVTQLEQPMDAAMRGLRLARESGARTILNPAPAAPLPDGMLALCDFVTPNESEAEALTGMPVRTTQDAARAARRLREMGARAAIVTLGEKGALYDDGLRSVHVPAFDAGAVVDTTGAGDAFNGGFATALANGADPVEAVRFGCATAAVSVTRPGAAEAMPNIGEIRSILE